MPRRPKNPKVLIVSSSSSLTFSCYSCASVLVLTTTTRWISGKRSFGAPGRLRRNLLARPLRGLRRDWDPRLPSSAPSRRTPDPPPAPANPAASRLSPAAPRSSCPGTGSRHFASS
eukprot:scaffold565_cov379-Pinguiococcus_pyrenoidosus.AAC.6